ncbi:MAG: DUF853 family protein [Candidatus Altiarchaeales archaeon]|nr:DUF853 family protein [Candidatus Altiarchaeales archaeon]
MEDYAGLVQRSNGNQAQVLVESEELEIGSILRIKEYFGIVSAMFYSEDEALGSNQRLIAETHLFGQMRGGRRRGVKKPAAPYSKAYFAGERDLEKLGDYVDSISVGRIKGAEARARLNASQYDRHIAVLASTGAGKSYACANLVAEFNGLGLPVLIVDTHGEYSRLLEVRREDIKTEVYTVRHERQGFKKFTIPVSNLSCSDYSHFINLNDNQLHALELVLNKTYSRYGENYSLENVIRVCEEVAEDAGKSSKTVHEETANALQRRLKALKRIYKEVFTVDGTDINRLITPHNVTIIDTSLATQAIRRSVVSYLSKKILEGRINKKHQLQGDRIDYPVLVLIEEAHNYAGSKVSHSCKKQLQQVAAEGRKFGVGLMVVSQKPSKIDEEILSQCNSGVYMHITNPSDKIHIKNSFECISEDIIQGLDSLDVGEAIIAGALIDLPYLICRIDEIKLKQNKKSKFNFKKPEKIVQGKSTEYI